MYKPDPRPVVGYQQEYSRGPSPQEGSTPGEDLPAQWMDMSVSSRTHSPAPTTSYNSTSTDGTVHVIQHSYEVPAHTDFADPENGMTELMYASAQTADGKDVQALLQAGASMRQQCHQGRTALMWAAYCGNFMGVVTLLENTSD